MGKKEKKCVYYENVCAKVMFCVMYCICDDYGIILGCLWQLVGLGMEGDIIAPFLCIKYTSTPTQLHRAMPSAWRYFAVFRIISHFVICLGGKINVSLLKYPKNQL